MRSELANIDNAEFAGAVTTHEQLRSVLANETTGSTIVNASRATVPSQRAVSVLIVSYP